MGKIAGHLLREGYFEQEKIKGERCSLSAGKKVSLL